MSLVLKDGFGYTVYHPPGDDIRALRCQFCTFSVRPSAYFRQGDRSGLGRYNRARAAIVKHVFSCHRASLEACASDPNVESNVTCCTSSG